MSNRTDFDNVARELIDFFIIGRMTIPELEKKIATNLHDAYVAGEEGNGCRCAACERVRMREDR